MKFLIDNGHGDNTPGKRSPDGLLREYKYTREIADEICCQLIKEGYDCSRIVPEDEDIPLSERVRRVNDIYNRAEEPIVLVSIHCNACPPDDGQWHTARGWSAYTSKGKTSADELATMLYEAAERNFSGHKIRKDYSDLDPDWEENFYILSKTKCPAVLTENFYQDNMNDVSYLLSLEGRRQIVKTHIEALKKYAQLYG